jgi:hypothetical protein
MKFLCSAIVGTLALALPPPLPTYAATVTLTVSAPYQFAYWDGYPADAVDWHNQTVMDTSVSMLDLVRFIAVNSWSGNDFVYRPEGHISYGNTSDWYFVDTYDETGAINFMGYYDNASGDADPWDVEENHSIWTWGNHELVSASSGYDQATGTVAWGASASITRYVTGAP